MSYSLLSYLLLEPTTIPDRVHREMNTASMVPAHGLALTWSAPRKLESSRGRCSHIRQVRACRAHTRTHALTVQFSSPFTCLSLASNYQSLVTFIFPLSTFVI